jgi:hypothetical protein
MGLVRGASLEGKKTSGEAVRIWEQIRIGLAEGASTRGLVHGGMNPVRQCWGTGLGSWDDVKESAA